MNHLMVAFADGCRFNSPLSHIECSYHNSKSIQTWGLYSGAKTTESRIIDNSFSIGVWNIMNPTWCTLCSSRAFQGYEECNKRCPGPENLKVTNKHNKQTTFYNKYIYIIKHIDILSMWNCLQISSIKDVHIWLWITLYFDFSDPKDI